MKKEQKATIGSVILVAILMIYVWMKNFVAQHPYWSIAIAVLFVGGAALLVYYTLKSPELKEKEITFLQHIGSVLKDIFGAMGEGGKEHKERIPIPEKTKMEVLSRAGHKCQICGSGTNLKLHHIDRNPGNNNSNNIIVLCPTHHDEADKGVRRKETLKALMHHQIVAKTKTI